MMKVIEEVSALGIAIGDNLAGFRVDRLPGERSILLYFHHEHRRSAVRITFALVHELRDEPRRSVTIHRRRRDATMLRLLHPIRDFVVKDGERPRQKDHKQQGTEDEAGPGMQFTYGHCVREYKSSFHSP